MKTNRGRIGGIPVSVAAVAIVTAAIFAFGGFVPVLSLGVLYLFAVLPVAVVFGLPPREAWRQNVRERLRPDPNVRAAVGVVSLALG